MVNENATVMNTLFDYCVLLLELAAQATGLTYKEINVWLFVIIHPLITLALFTFVIILRQQNRKLKQTQLKPPSSDAR